MTHLTYNGLLRSEAEAEVVATLKGKGWVETVPPSYDPASEHPPQWVEGEWSVRSLTAEELAAKSRKVWPNSATFLQNIMVVLGDQAISKVAAIQLSTHPVIAAMRLKLSVWPGEVWSDNAEILMGLDALVATKILTQEQVNQVLAK